MKKKNGFTLVELVAILAVLGVIAILVLPGVKSNINNKKEKQYNNIVNVIENAAKSYYYQTSSGTKITLEELANNKYIDSDITNPKTNEKMTGCVIVSKDNGYNTFKYIDESSCEKLLPGYGKGTKYIKELYKNETERAKNGLKKDNTSDANIRYEGSNPNNYVKFNDELWRIIGVFGDNIKLIRSESIGNKQWNKSDSSINGGGGINQWGESKDSSGNLYIGANLKIYLNEEYYDSIESKAKLMIENYTWRIGAIDWETRTNTVTFYNKERGNTNGKICTGGDYCNDTILRTTTWTGYVALAYITDYAYASSELVCATNMNDGYDAESGSYDNMTCKKNNWIYLDVTTWYLSPYALSSRASRAWALYSHGSMHGDDTTKFSAVFPTIYLKPDVNIVGGTGTSTDPYILSRS